MPADYQSAAEALAVSPSRATPSPPPWSGATSTRRRLSSAALRSASQKSFLQRMWSSLVLLNDQVVKAYLRLSPLWRVIAILVAVLGWVVLILAAVYSHAFFEWLAPISKSWRELPGGWLIIFGFVFLVSFPPVIGYSTANTIAGFVYGFPLGWPIVAGASTIGSLAAFIACRTVLSGYVDRMVGKDHRFVALGQVLRREGLLYLTAIRFCPLPYSLSNGFLATIPSISPAAFALSTAISSPKLLVHVFIGSRLAILAEKGDAMTLGDKAINYLSMLIGGGIGAGVGFIIYRRTMARAAELALEDAGVSAAEQGDAGYEDGEGATLMDPDDAAELMLDDDMSLWDTQVEDYRDDDRDGVQGDDDVDKNKKSQGAGTAGDGS